MNIPIDKLYHYLETVARDVYGYVVIYHFYPHGSKKLEDLQGLRKQSSADRYMLPSVYCHDQEPLSYNLYTNQILAPRPGQQLFKKYNIAYNDEPFIKYPSIYNKRLLIHSEKRSPDIDLFQQKNFIPIYYWSHGIIALDWYRYASYEKLNKNVKKTFLIYNRAWSGTREYRLKFVDLLIDYNLIDQCQTTFSPIEPELQLHYTKHQFVNLKFQSSHQLENYLLPNSFDATASADYEINDYNTTNIEVVLETLFDDQRLHLTEKILRPIALGQPFILAATQGSLEYLRSYGFRTFGSVFDESYDTIKDPVLRLEAIVTIMKEITEWTAQECKEKIALANQIALYNRKHFFSNKFFGQIEDELIANLKQGFAEFETTVDTNGFFELRKQAAKFEEIKKHILELENRQDIIKILTKAKEYRKH
jgi:hypothetical protein